MLNPVVSACQALYRQASRRQASCTSSISTKAIKCPLTRPTSLLPWKRHTAHQLWLITNSASSLLSPWSSCSTIATCLLLLAGVLLPVCQASSEATLIPTAGDHLRGEPTSDIGGGLSALLSGSFDDKLLGGSGEPRQYFKLRVIPSPSKSARKKKAHARVAGNKSEQKQKITNAALKKLLNQSLLKAANSNSTFNNNLLGSGVSTGSNFRLVFVQRAPVLPAPSSSTTTTSTANPPTSTGTTNKNADSGSFLDAKKTSPSSSSSTSRSSNSSSGVAGNSLTKQLAETFISSTLNMAFNSPSISSLASKLAVKGIETMIANRNSSSSSNIDEAKVKNAGKIEHAPLSTSINSKTRQPSKVYNLPIKFVADGQPYHITVLTALKKHLLSSASSNTGSNGVKKTYHKSHHSASGVAPASIKVSKHSDQSGKRRKLEQASKKKETHGNSRLIYLPLKYFNNGRISKVIINSSSDSSSSSNSFKRKGR